MTDAFATMKVSVNAEALQQVLQALVGPPHHIRELQAIRSPIIPNPVDRLINEYNEWFHSPETQALLKEQNGK